MIIDVTSLMLYIRVRVVRSVSKVPLGDGFLQRLSPIEIKYALE